MKKALNQIKVLLLVAVVAIAATSCKKEKTEYQVRIQNDMQNELSLLGLSVPFMKYDVKEFTLGEHTFTNVLNGQFSNYVTIESSTDYTMSVTVDVYFYNADSFEWEYSMTETHDLGTESWVDDEDYVKHKIKLQMGDILQAYKPIYSKYAEE